MTALLSACSGGGSSGPINALPVAMPTVTAVPSPTPTPGQFVASTSTTLAEGVGIPYYKGTRAFSDGDTASGGQGNATAAVTCSAGISMTYHIHVHLSILSGSSQAYVPQAIGLPNPGTTYGTFPNTYTDVGACAYDLHTHDYSGIIHVESASQPAQPFTLGQFFAVWGQTLSTTNVGPLTGDVHVYRTQTAPDARAIAQPTLIPVEWLSSFAAVPLVDHEEITIVIGPSQLPLPRYTWPQDIV